MNLFKKSDERFERDLRKLYNIKEMLNEEGQGDGECRYKVFVADLLLFIDLSLHRIGLVLFAMLGFEIGKFISGLF